MSSIDQPLTGVELHTPAPAGSQVYPVTPEGKRVATVLLVGVVSIAIFAVWTIVTLFDGGLSGPEWVTAALMLALFALSPLVAWNLLEERAAVISTDESGLTFQSLGGISLFYPWSQVRGLRSAAERKSRIAAFLFEDTDGDDGKTQLAQTRASGLIEAKSDELAAGEITKVVPASNNEENVAAATAENGGLSKEPDTDDDDETISGAQDRETLEIVVNDPGLGRIANPVVRALHRQSHGRFVPVYPGTAQRDQLLQEIARHSAGSS